MGRWGDGANGPRLVNSSALSKGGDGQVTPVAARKKWDLPDGLAVVHSVNTCQEVKGVGSIRLPSKHSLILIL